jgi:S-DNA-T family DNA segregation ATPase FtsK/SpoIIIE
MATLNRRERLCDALRIRSPKVFRQRRTQGELEGESNGEVFLFVDSWPDFAGRYPDESRLLLRVAQQGVYYGIHLVVSADRWRDLPEDLVLYLGNVVELALADPRESRIDSELAGSIPPGQPGFGLTRGRRYVRLAVPALARTEKPARAGTPSQYVRGDEGEELDALLGKVAAAWPGPGANALSGLGNMDQAIVPLLDLLPMPEQWDAAASSVWPPRSTQRLTTPVGVDAHGSPVLLDLKEASMGGWGPHGVCVGATGSGKSELLRTLVLGLAVTHSPDTLNFVLVDFKGGATFSEMERLPHTAAAITDLADELSLVHRMGESIRGELNRRQEMLRSSGNYTGILDYQRARAAGASLMPLPTLVVVIDEFGELLSAAPDFADVLISIGRIGRSLGVHLVLASQRLDEEQLRGLDAYLSYRIALRTFSAAESRAVLGAPDAYHLPAVPGSGYLQYDMDHRIAFRAPYASGWPAGDARAADGDSPMEVILNRLEAQGPAAHQVWLPPLDSPPSLDSLLPGLRYPGVA